MTRRNRSCKCARAGGSISSIKCSRVSVPIPIFGSRVAALLGQPFFFGRDRNGGAGFWYSIWWWCGRCDSMGSLARHLVIPTLITDFHREGIFRPSGNRKRLSSAPTLTSTLTLKVL